jgi:hypothetical protein
MNKFETPTGPKEAPATPPPEALNNDIFDRPELKKDLSEFVKEYTPTPAEQKMWALQHGIMDEKEAGDKEDEPRTGPPTVHLLMKAKKMPAKLGFWQKLSDNLGRLFSRKD